MKKVLIVVLALSVFYGCKKNQSTTSSYGGAPAGEIEELSDFDFQVKTGYPTLVIYSGNSCMSCKKEEYELNNKITQFRNKMYIYHLNVDTIEEGRAKIPCNLGTTSVPQNQFFDEDAKQITCILGYGSNVREKIEELTGIDVDPDVE